MTLHSIHYCLLLMKIETAQQLLRCASQGRCTRGEFCNFAHEQVEVRGLPDLEKTKMCEEQLTNGKCTNPQCSFAHKYCELRSTEAFFKTRLCEDWLLSKCFRGTTCRMAHGLQELRKATCNRQPCVTLPGSQTEIPISAIPPCLLLSSMPLTHPETWRPSVPPPPPPEKPPTDEKSMPPTSYTHRCRFSIGSPSPVSSINVSSSKKVERESNDSKQQFMSGHVATNRPQKVFRGTQPVHPGSSITSSPVPGSTGAVNGAASQYNEVGVPPSSGQLRCNKTLNEQMRMLPGVMLIASRLQARNSKSIKSAKHTAELMRHSSVNEPSTAWSKNQSLLSQEHGQNDRRRSKGWTSGSGAVFGVESGGGGTTSVVKNSVYENTSMSNGQLIISEKAANVVEPDTRDSHLYLPYQKLPSREMEGSPLPNTEKTSTTGSVDTESVDSEDLNTECNARFHSTTFRCSISQISDIDGDIQRNASCSVYCSSIETASVSRSSSRRSTAPTNSRQSSLDCDEEMTNGAASRGSSEYPRGPDNFESSGSSFAHEGKSSLFVEQFRSKAPELTPQIQPTVLMHPLSSHKTQSMDCISSPSTLAEAMRTVSSNTLGDPPRTMSASTTIGEPPSPFPPYSHTKNDALQTVPVMELNVTSSICNVPWCFDGRPVTESGVMCSSVSSPISEACMRETNQEISVLGSTCHAPWSLEGRHAPICEAFERDTSDVGSHRKPLNCTLVRAWATPFAAHFTATAEELQKAPLYVDPQLYED